MTVLLVEDDPLDRILATRTLSDLSLNCEVLHFGDGQALVDYIEDNSLSDVGLILLDLKMPRLDGLETLAVLRDKGLTVELPTVVMSSSDLDRDVKRAYELGARAFLTKPISHDEFREAIRGVGLFWCKYNRLPIAA